MPGQTGSIDRRDRSHVVSIRLTSTELRHLRELTMMRRCVSHGELPRELIADAREQMLHDLARW